MTRTLIIGDIHGCYEEMRRLIALADLGPNDRIIAVGDLVDRGPASPAVVDYFANEPRALALMGNHERKHIAGRRGDLKLTLSQIIARRQFELAGISYDEAVDYMATLPAYVELPECIIVHGYLEPGVPLAQQRERVLTGTMGGGAYLKETGAWPWYKHYRGAKPVVVGHYNYLHGRHPLLYKERVYGLDTSCVRGAALTGLLLPGFRTISVHATRNHWVNVRAQHPDLSARRKTPTQMGWKPLARWLQEAESKAARKKHDPAQYAYLARTRQVLEEAQGLLPYLQMQVQAAAAALSGELDGAFPPQRLAAAFDARIPAGSPLRSLLHLARRDLLTPEKVRDVTHNPDHVLTLVEYLARHPR